MLQHFEIRTAIGTFFINPNNILYIRGFNKHSIVYFIDDQPNKDNNIDEVLKSIETHHLLRWFEYLLPIPDFIRCHDSYIINSSFICYRCGNNFGLSVKIKVPISRGRKEQVINNYKSFIMSRNT